MYDYESEVIFKEDKIKKKVFLGTLYKDDEPLLLPSRPIFTGNIHEYNSKYEYRIGNTSSEHSYKLKWVEVEDVNNKNKTILIADRNLLTRISWLDLNKMGLIHGSIIYIDGERYLCRVLNVRGKNEWKSALEQVSDLDTFWHYKSILSICQNVKLDEYDWRFCDVVGAFLEPDQVSFTQVYTSIPSLGWRPVLEKL